MHTIHALATKFKFKDGEMTYARQISDHLQFCWPHTGLSVREKASKLSQVSYWVYKANFLGHDTHPISDSCIAPHLMQVCTLCGSAGLDSAHGGIQGGGDSVYLWVDKESLEVSDVRCSGLRLLLRWLQLEEVKICMRPRWVLSWFFLISCSGPKSFDLRGSLSMQTPYL